MGINKPLIPVNHIEGHICANYPENKDLEPPFVILVISGGHTYLAICSEYGKYEIVGQTKMMRQVKHLTRLPVQSA